MRFVIAWVIWLIFADKKRWRELLPVGVFAGFLGSTSDTLMANYPLWEYPGDRPLIPLLTDDWSIYIVVPYLFVQWLPGRREFWPRLVYWFIWTAVTSGVEFVHVATGHMVYHRWWNLGWSYAADWILFWLFYQYHKIFQLSRLSGDGYGN
ncbi:MAG: hypothetical protein K6T80_04805 [Firmicutes bacterium]|nr:hypothetical protein [Bacillota bacterium]